MAFFCFFAVKQPINQSINRYLLYIQALNTIESTAADVDPENSILKPVTSYSNVTLRYSIMFN